MVCLVFFGSFSFSFVVVVVLFVCLFGVIFPSYQET